MGVKLKVRIRNTNRHKKKKSDILCFQWIPGARGRVHIERDENVSFRAHAVLLA